MISPAHRSVFPCFAVKFVASCYQLQDLWWQDLSAGEHSSLFTGGNSVKLKHFENSNFYRFNRIGLFFRNVFLYIIFISTSTISLKLKI